MIVEKLLEQLFITKRRLERFKQAREEMIHKKVDKYRIRIIEYGIEVEELRYAWLQDILAEHGVTEPSMEEV